MLFSTDRVGLIIFGEDAFIQCPLTYDASALSLFIETLHTGLVPNGGTDFAPPLKLAKEKLLNEAKGASSKSSHLVILVSDGEDFGEEAQEIAREYRSEKHKTFNLRHWHKRGGGVYPRADAINVPTRARRLLPN